MNGVLRRHLSHDYHPPTDRLLGVVIKSHGHSLSLENLPRCLVGESLRTWDSVPSTTKFTYISMVNRITSISLFEIVIFCKARVPIDLISMFAFHYPFENASILALHFHSLHQGIRCKIAMSNERSKQSADLHHSHHEFQVGDLVMIQLHVSSGHYKVLNKIRPNAYVLDIPTNLGTNPTFHVETLLPYHSNSIPDPQPSANTQTLVFQPPQPMPLFPSITTCREEIEVTINDQIISTQQRGYQRYIVKWKDRPEIDSAYLTESELR